MKQTDGCISLPKAKRASTMRYSIHGQGLGCGKLTLSGAEVEHAFSNVIKNVIQSCNKLIGPPRIGVGPTSACITSCLCIASTPRRWTWRVTFVSPNFISAASLLLIHFQEESRFSDRAVVWYTKQLVRGRAARWSCGMVMGVDYKPSLHREREMQTYLNSQGLRRNCV